MRALNQAILALLLIALVLIQCLIGGTRLTFSLPSYGIIAVAGLLAAFAVKRVKSGAARDCLATSAVFFGYVLVRAAMSPVQYLWWPDFYMVLACLVVYLLTALHLTSSTLRMVFVCGLIALALVQVLIGLRQYTGHDNWMPFGFRRADYGSRASGMFISSIHLAGLLEVASGFAMSLAFWAPWKNWLRFLIGYLALICYVGVAITGSRGGYASTLVSLVTFYILSIVALRRARPARFRATATLGGMALLLAVGGGFLAMQQSSMIRERVSLIGQKDVRFYNWQAALDQFRAAPVIGTGAGTHLYYGRMFRRPEIQSDPVHAHSDYLELLAEYGVVGALGVAAFLATHLRSGMRALFRLLRDRLEGHHPFEPIGDTSFALQIGCLCGVAAYLAHSAVDFNLHIPANALMFAFIFGILARPDTDEAVTQPDAVVTSASVALPACALLIIGAGLPKLPGEYWCEQSRLALRDRHYQDAIELGARALTYQRLNPELYFYIGDANRALANSLAARTTRGPFLEKAVTAYRSGIALFPQDENLWVRLGQALDGLRRFPDAETAYCTAINLDPNLGVLYAFYAAHLNARGRLEEAQAQEAAGHKLTSSENIVKIGESTLPPPNPEPPPDSQ